MPDVIPMSPAALSAGGGELSALDNRLRARLPRTDSGPAEGCWRPPRAERRPLFLTATYDGVRTRLAHHVPLCTSHFPFGGLRCNHVSPSRPCLL